MDQEDKELVTVAGIIWYAVIVIIVVLVNF